MYVGAFKRLLALIIDNIIFTGFCIICYVIINTLFAPQWENSYFHIARLRGYVPLNLTSYQENLFILYYGMIIVVQLIFETLFVYSPLSGTPGKILMNIEVSCYRNASFLKVLIRTLTKVIALYTGISIIEFFVIVFNKKKQSIHDMLASTVVNYKESSFIDTKTQRDIIIQQLDSGFIKTYDEILELKESLPQPKSIVQSSSNSRIWWLLVIAMIFVTVGFNKTTYKTIIQNVREITQTVAVSTDESYSEKFEGTWNNNEWTIKFTYQNGKLNIFDSKYIFREYSPSTENTLKVEDYKGESLIIKRSGDALVATYEQPVGTTGNIVFRSHIFTRQPT